MISEWVIKYFYLFLVVRTFFDDVALHLGRLKKENEQLGSSFFGCDSIPINPNVRALCFESNLDVWLCNGLRHEHDKLNLANLVGEVMDEIVEFQIFFTFRKQVVSTCHQCMDGQF